MTLGDCKAWIGRSHVAEDVVTPRLITSFKATLAPHLAEVDPGAPLGLHWCLAPEIVEAAKLGSDGHPAKGDFLPPVPFPKRMAAGGTLSFLSPLISGDRVQRRSTIASIEGKAGQSGHSMTIGLKPRSAACRTEGSIPTSRPIPTKATAIMPQSRNVIASGVPSKADMVILSKTASFG